MAKKSKSIVWRMGVLLVACAVAWMQYQENTASAETGHKARKSHTSKSTQQGTHPKKSSSREYETLERCSLIPHKHNDGDSFHVRTPKTGEDVEFRLYFVDAPESAAKTYGHGANNYKRLAEQGRYFGGLSQKETVRIGAEAKQFVTSLLSRQKFKVTTRWEPVYNSDRRYAFVTVQWEGKPQYLHEILVSKGYARIHTLGRELPEGGKSYYQQKAYLQQLERTAKKNHRGAWGL